MTRLIVFTAILFIIGCAQNVKTAPLVGGCLNWRPYNFNEKRVRIDTTPEAVLIAIDKNLEHELLRALGKDNIYKERCWYRNVITGGVTLEPAYEAEESSYDFEQSNGKWFLSKERGFVQIHW